jgi:16S rRNA (guanine527-N7)-methyltransferase
MSIINIRKASPSLSDTQYQQLDLYQTILNKWNESINVVSRKDIENLETKHILPSLMLGQICCFHEGARIMDVGTGGGLPGIPLAIMYPNAKFLLVDSIGKKLKVVEAAVTELELKNVSIHHGRAEEIKQRFDFIVGRAVTSLDTFLSWIKGKIAPGEKSSLKNGILYLKGGDFSEEIQAAKVSPNKIYQLGELLDNQFCQDKCILYLSYDKLKR